MRERDDARALQEKEHHFYYEVFRAADVDELIPASVKSAPAPVLPSGAPADTRLKALETEWAEAKKRSNAFELIAGQIQRRQLFHVRHWIDCNNHIALQIQILNLPSMRMIYKNKILR